MTTDGDRSPAGRFPELSKGRAARFTGSAHRGDRRTQPLSERPAAAWRKSRVSRRFAPKRQRQGIVGRINRDVERHMLS